MAWKETKYFLSGGVANNGCSVVTRATLKVLLFKDGLLVPLTSMELALRWQSVLLL